MKIRKLTPMPERPEMVAYIIECSLIEMQALQELVERGSLAGGEYPACPAEGEGDVAATIDAVSV